MPLGSRSPARVDRTAGVRRRTTLHGLPSAAAIGPPRLTGQRITVTILNEGVDAREKHRKQCGRDRAPQSEREKADAAAQTAAHALGHDAGLNDR